MNYRYEETKKLGICPKCLKKATALVEYLISCDVRTYNLKQEPRIHEQAGSFMHEKRVCQNCLTEIQIDSRI
jgi:hypothetical protein